MSAADLGRDVELVIATLCERATRDANGMLTIAGIIDELALPAAAPAGGVPVRATLVLVLRGGEPDAEHEITVMRQPPGEPAVPYPPMRVVLTRQAPGAVPGAQAFLTVDLSVKNPGTYWFDVAVDRRHLAAVPILVSPAR